MKVLVVWAMAWAMAISASGQDPLVRVVKGRRYSQTTSAGPVAQTDPTAFFFEAEATGLESFEPVHDPQVTFPGGQARALSKAAPGSYSLQTNAATQAALDLACPGGRYQFAASINLIGLTKAHAQFPAGDFPAVPRIENFNEVRAIDPAADFSLTWSSFPDSRAEDLISLRVVETSSGRILLDEQEIDSSTVEWSFSSGTFQMGQSYHVTLSFAHLAQESSPDGDELLPGRAFRVSETSFDMVASGQSGGGDTLPPSLVSVVPVSDSLLDSVFSPVALQFSEPMDTSRVSIRWEALLNGTAVPLEAAKFSQIWSEDGTTLVFTYGLPGGGWPSGLVVTWTLNAQPHAVENFRDVAGNELPSATGRFVTAGGADPCSSPVADGVPGSVFGFFKQINYRQTNPDLPVPDTELGAQAFAFMQLPSSTPVQTIATLKVPTSNPFAFKLKVLSPPAGATTLALRFLQEQFPARADLDEAYPAGTYLMELRNSAAQSTNAVPLNVPATGYPPTPHVVNFAACQTITASADFNVQWEPFSGASSNAVTGLNVFDAEGALVFHAPDPCRHLTLDPAAGGIILPGGTLASNRTYSAELTFSRLADSGKTLPGIAGTGFVSLTRITRFPLKTGEASATLSAPQFESLALSGPGTLDVTLQCMSGRPLVIEAAPAVGAAFSAVLTTNPPTGRITLTLPISAGRGFFRAQQK